MSSNRERDVIVRAAPRRVPISNSSIDWLEEVIEKRPEMLREDMARDLLRRVLNELKANRADIRKCKNKLFEIHARIGEIVEEMDSQSLPRGEDGNTEAPPDDRDGPPGDEGPSGL